MPEQGGMNVKKKFALRAGALMVLIPMILPLCACGTKESHSYVDSSTSANSEETSTSLISTDVTTDNTVTSDTSKSATAVTSTTTAQKTTKGVTTKKPISTTSKAPENKKYTNPYNIYNVMKGYCFGSPLTDRQLLPTMAYMVDGKIKDTMCDAIIIMPSPVNIYWGNFGRKSDWESWMYKQTFADGKNLDAMDTCGAQIASALGKKDYKINAFVTLVNPNPQYYSNWGELNGKAMDFNNEEDRFTAAKWMIDSYLAEFKKQNYKYVKLAGFYWFDEYIEQKDIKFIKRVTDYVRSTGHITIFSAFYRAGGYDKWKECGFDLASMQSNYFPSEPGLPNAGPVSRLTENVYITQARGMGIEMELDNASKKNGITGFKQTMEVLIKNDRMNDYHVLYFGSGVTTMYEVQKSRDKYTRSVYDELYKFIHGKLTLDELWLEPIE